VNRFVNKTESFKEQIQQFIYPNEKKKLKSEQESLFQKTSAIYFKNLALKYNFTTNKIKY
jgi:hypothetical protein